MLNLGFPHFFSFARKLSFQAAFLFLPFQSIQLGAQTVWFKRTVPLTSELKSVAYGGGFFSAVASGRSKALQSRDGRFWTASPLPDVVNQVGFCAKVGKEAFYGVGLGSGIGGGGLFKAVPGAAYEITSELDAGLRAVGGVQVMYGVSAFRESLAVLAYRAPDAVMRANVLCIYGKTGWMVQQTELTSAQGAADERELSADGVVLGESKVLIFAGLGNVISGGGRVWCRDLAGFPEGSWREIPAPGGEGWGDLVAGAYGVGHFVLVGKGGSIFRIRENAPTAERIPSRTSASLSGVVFGPKSGGCWVAVGACGTILYSPTPNADYWLSAPTRVLDDLNAVTFGVNSFLAVGEGGVILQSN